ncbi:nitrite/sulfite reductase [Sulfurimonas xiamenensis]|uniref:Nitrite/sulfite reductase n=1 Tax=Sulfurimonas xiamenensis TaxID=2590021 RepID=A0AAJ4A450_9BACT|nr:nitrite/sulfite reductase [Sulfurimonas xiamenensis]QFR43423.1 nitrite/sulfite reductase [Sulfurimonas xiamenensis]
MENKLNKRERYKAQLKPIDYYKDFENIDFENLGEGDRFYLQDFGIFNTDFLEDEFTLRIRVPGGRISTEQFQKIADIVEEYDLTIILTARGGIQLHDIEADNVLEIHKRINALGVSTWQSFGDNVRNIVTDPYDGCGIYSEIEVYPIVLQMQDYIVKNPRYVGMLPRRISVGISGNRANVTSFFANDIYFALAKKENQLGFNVYMGGKNTEVAQSADIFLQKNEVFDFFKAFIEAFYLHGSRFSRAKTRIFHMIEDIGMDGLKAFIQKEYKKDFQGEGELILEKKEFSKFHKLKDKRFGFCYQTDFSRLTADEIKEIALYATKNSAEIRFGIDQNIYIIGLKEPSTTLNSPALSETIIACAGNLCPYAVWSIKDETSYLPLEKINKYRIQVGFSGCAKGCGRHRHTDIGLIGLKTNNFGDTEGGARVFLGALHSDGKSVSRQLFSMVPFVHLHKVLSLIIDLFEKSGYTNFEEYANDILIHYSEDFLSLWILANLETNSYILLPKLENMQNFEYEKKLLKEEFEDLDFWQYVDNSFFDAVSYLSKKLWTVEGEDPHYKPKIQRTNFR